MCETKSYPHPQPLSDREVRDLLAASKGDKDWHDVVLLALHTGLRVGEIRNLRWTDVDLADRWLFIAPGKSRSSRKVPFDRAVSVALEARRERQQQPTAFVLGDDPAATLSRVQRHMHRFGGSHNCSVTFHVLRHTWAKRLIDAGCDVVVLSVIGGWSISGLTTIVRLSSRTVAKCYDAAMSLLSHQKITTTEMQFARDDNGGISGNSQNGQGQGSGRMDPFSASDSAQSRASEECAVNAEREK